jgi:hypothetical protein
VRRGGRTVAFRALRLENGRLLGRYRSCTYRLGVARVTRRDVTTAKGFTGVRIRGLAERVPRRTACSL